MNDALVEYKKIDAADISFLIGVCGADGVVSAEISEDYQHDELTAEPHAPDVVIFPRSTEEVATVLRYANEHRIPITPRGQGTGLVGGAVSVLGGIMLILTRMNRILELDEDNLTLTVEPGVLLMDISKFVEERGLFYPPDPGEKSATIGGNISTNAGGMRAVKYGVTRDYVRGLEVVLADGTIMELGGKVVKNSSGYALKDLIVGSEGTLALVTKAVLRLLPLPAKAISLLVPFPSLQLAIGAVPKIIRSKAIPTAVEFIERGVILAAEEFLGKQFPDKSADAYLLLTFDGATKEEVERSYDAVARICLDNEALDVFISDTAERQDSIWSARRAFLEAIKASTSELDECDVVVPRKQVAEFIGYVAELQKCHGVRMQSFGHAGDGNLHIYALRDDMDESEWKPKLAAVFDALYTRAKQIGGLVSGEHGIGFAKRDYLRESMGETGITLLRGIKASFDPHGILNPGKVC